MLTSVATVDPPMTTQLGIRVRVPRVEARVAPSLIRDEQVRYTFKVEARPIPRFLANPTPRCLNPKLFTNGSMMIDLTPLRCSWCFEGHYRLLCHRSVVET
jgi:hypothetical protein